MSQGKNHDEQIAACDHEWVVLDVTRKKVGRYNDLYYHQGREVETRRFYCSKCREVAEDKTVREGVGLRD